MNHLLCFGFGFSAQVLARQLDPASWRVTGTSRSASGVAAIRAQGFEACAFEEAAEALSTATHVVTSAPPDERGDPVLRLYHDQFAARALALRWVAYLSTTGVYGDHAGAWVDEDTPLTPNTERGERRLLAEREWLALWQQHGVPVHLFRLAGIYGPGRNSLLNLMEGTAQRIIKPGQVFSRIHVDDIAGVLEASMAKPHAGRAYNVADDEPAPPQDVIAHGAHLLGLPVPPDVPFETAKLSPMARSFYADSKKVSNTRVKTELGYSFRHPNFREGLQSLLPTLTRGGKGL